MQETTLSNLHLNVKDYSPHLNEVIRFQELFLNLHVAIHRADSLENLCETVTYSLSRMQRYSSLALVIDHPILGSIVKQNVQDFGFDGLIHEWQRTHTTIPCFERCLQELNSLVILGSEKQCRNCNFKFLSATVSMIPVSLAYNGERFGVLFVELNTLEPLQVDELHLFESLGEDIGFRLHQFSHEKVRSSKAPQLFAMEENSSITIFQFGWNGTILHCSESMNRWGYSATDFTEFPLVSQLFPELDLTRLKTKTVLMTPVVTASNELHQAIIYPVVQREDAVSVIAFEADPLIADLNKTVPMNQQIELLYRFGFTFNTNLSVIMGNSAIMHEKLMSHEIDSSELDEIDRSARTLQSMIAELSETETAEPGTAIPLTELIATVQPKINELASSEISIRWETVPQPVTVPLSRTEFEQVILAILQNSVESIYGAGSVAISLELSTIKQHRRFGTAILVPQTYLVLTVTDSGCGISEKEIGSVFEPFFTTKSRLSYSGMGLTASQLILNKTGGGIQIHSTENSGTTVSCMIPIADFIDDSVVPEPSTPNLSSRSEQITVMVVDDEAVVCTVMSRMVELLEHKSESFLNGKDALKRIEERGPEQLIILTDFLMPGMDGEELTKRLKRLYPELPVIFHTGETRTKILQDLISLHKWKDVYRINKPVIISDLKDLLEHVISQSFMKSQEKV